MRYALIFAGVAAAYDAYGSDSYPEYKASSSTPAVKYSTSAPAYGGYGEEHKTSSSPAPSTTPCSSSKLGYTTIYPGYGKQPVTVTSQYQPYPTCGAAGSDGKSCNKWNDDKYVSTVINDYNSKKVTVTHVEKPITVYQTKTTITHYPTASSGKAYSTGSYGSYDTKKNATQPWYEMNEKIHEIKYKDLGAHGLPGYGGSGLCKTCDDEQPYKVKEYKNGKWSEYEATAIYKAPTPETKTYEKPGVYTEPAKDVTVTYTITRPSEATTTAKAGVPVTYGGYTTDFKSTGVKTCAYGAYETGKDKNGNDVTSTVVKTVTVTVSTTGKYEVAKPTTTVYAHDTEVKYPTVSVYKPGVYHKDAQTVTITKSGDSASCEYKQTKTYPAMPEKTPAYGDEYPYGGKSSSKPSVETKTYSQDYPHSTPVYGDEYPPYSQSSSEPSIETKTSIYYPEYPASSSTPVYDDKKSSSTPCPSSSKPYAETKTYPAYPTSTPVHGEEYPPYKFSSSKPSVETKTNSEDYPHSTPVYGGEYPPAKISSVPAHPATTTVPYHEDATSTPCPSSTNPVVDYKSTAYPEYPEYPAASSSAPVHDDKPTPTPANYDDSNKFSYAPSPSKTAAAYPEYSAEPSEDKENSYETGNGYGYAKRAGVVQRRQANVAQRGNRV
ncbi:uncharacterized protein M421DRAFT_425819 [Didymella exigua CBS 183.55]|uniref:Uncharacterized protein n=1 Tax=Didymella exigua CBS 183.55 TaxID=1150837 RepID=A0A6A5RCF5_9PLEO|nr:uncharacterized protein M421DRAFT_425819 [Didymella exigua CBS 183.55]KAF1923447.1 hypothetical protein M421DRAFT_425819 [Didymella exigua CBS 183.55]